MIQLSVRSPQQARGAAELVSLVESHPSSKAPCSSPELREYCSAGEAGT